MKKIISIETILLIIIFSLLMAFKYYQGFENTVCVISAIIIVELIKLNSKKQTCIQNKKRSIFT